MAGRKRLVCIMHFGRVRKKDLIGKKEDAESNRTLEQYNHWISRTHNQLGVSIWEAVFLWQKLFIRVVLSKASCRKILATNTCEISILDTIKNTMAISAEEEIALTSLIFLE